MCPDNNKVKHETPSESSTETKKKTGKERFSLKKWFKEKSGWYKLAILILGLISVTGALVTAFYTYDYTENNPKFCVSCHLMKEAFQKWEGSPHKTVNCHECHYATVYEKNVMFVKFLFTRPTAVAERHDKLIVPHDTCDKCHWHIKDKGSKTKINSSPIHIKHVFIERIECTKCHGTELHEFIPEPRFCVKCHKGKEVHGVGMEGLACLSCHIKEGAKEITPNRDKCLKCHKNIKLHVTFPKERDGAMHFNCSVCHKPHKKIKPTTDDCLKCHFAATQFKKHKMHIEIVQKDCKICHKPHKWRIDEADAKETCAKCHEYRPLSTFF